MTGWILAACAVAFATKFTGYVVPVHWLESPVILRLSSLVTVGLLAALVAVNALGAGTAIVVDARIVALGAAAVALWLRAPYILVVIVGALAAALARWLGWG